MRNIYMKLADIEGDLQGIVIATVISTSGSTPAKAGSSALFGSKGLLSGTIGGGILEGRVTLIAREYSGNGNSAILDFEFDKDISRKDEAICGGRASVLVDANLTIHNNFFRSLKEMLLRRISVVIATSVSSDGDGRMTVKRELYHSGDANIPSQGKTEDLILLETISPPKQLIIAGAGHIGKVLCHLGSLLDFEVTVIDDRSEFANRENLPDADKIIAGDIGTAMESIEKDNDTFVVIVTRGHSDDSNALKACIESNTAYTGMIGSKTKIEKMKRNFIENGWATPEKWASLHTPVGLEIGSRTVEEIAVSIAAELVLVRNAGN
jgi:xanthine dehydrogenase accessory factor